MLNSLFVAIAMLVANASAMAVVPAGGKVVVVGGGAVQCLTARLAALRGFSTTIALPDQEMNTGKALIFDDKHPEGSLPITLMAISGADADSDLIETCVQEAEGLIICFDNEQAFMPGTAMDVFTKGSNLKQISVMSRYLNGAGMGFFANAAKLAANMEVWAAPDPLVKGFKDQEAMVQKRAKELGASCTIIRAGTLKGGASGDASLDDGSGEGDFLNPYFYTLGQQDVVNWRLLYDCNALAVDLKKGDTMPGPGFTAALTATSTEGGAGDSHRGAVASALVESMRVEAAQDGDFSVASQPGKEFPKPEAWSGLFASA